MSPLTSSERDEKEAKISQKLFFKCSEKIFRRSNPHNMNVQNVAHTMLYTEKKVLGSYDTSIKKYRRKPAKKPDNNQLPFEPL